MKRVRVSRGGAVECRAFLELPLSSSTVWGQIRDFHRYAQQDLFHADIRVDQEIPRQGAPIQLWHRYAGIRISRVGRILVWREGVGFSFSDLSRRGPAHGFPHVFSYRIEPTGVGSSRLHVIVRGKWTASRVPRWMARLWLWWVFSQVVRNARNELLLYQIWRRSRKP